MSDIFKRLSVAYLAGALGGAAYVLADFLIRHGQLLFSHSPAGVLNGLTWSAFTHPVLLGSLWGLLCVPLGLILRVRSLWFGFILGLVPSVYLLFIQYPAQHHGATIFSSAPGQALWITVLFLVWGVTTGMLYISQYRA